MRKLILLFVRIMFRLISRIEVEGAENIPASGACIGVSNHIGRLDVALVFYWLNREDVVLMVAEKYRQQALWRMLVKYLDLIWVDRFNADLKALREVQKRLNDGYMLAMAPEGTRSPNAALQAGHPGTAYLASKTGVPIIPMGFIGTEDAHVTAQLKRFRRAHIKIRIGKPFTLPPLDRKNRNELLAQQTGEIMARIAVLLPPDYRGVYADHPRVKTLLAEQQEEVA